MTIKSTTQEISVTALKEELDNNGKPIILDVREPHELEIAKIDISDKATNLHIPMRELTERLSELDNYKDKDLVIYCRSGGRSGRCVQFLQSQGFKRVFNLTGGILAWADEIDPSITKY